MDGKSSSLLDIDLVKVELDHYLVDTWHQVSKGLFDFVN